MHAIFITNDKFKTELQISSDYTLISNFSVLTDAQIKKLIGYVRNALKYSGRVAVLVSPKEFAHLPDAIIQNAQVIDQTTSAAVEQGQYQRSA